jgi:hypothetical protein
MPDVKIRHELDCDAETYWMKCVFNDDYNKRLYLDTLKFPEFKLLEQEDAGDTIRRKLHLSPSLEGMPGPVKKAMGDKFSWIEEGTLDKKTNRYTFKITPSSMADKTKNNGVLYTESIGDKKIARLAEILIEVKVFLVGGMIEEKIISDLKASYEAAARFTNEYVKEKGY